MYPNFKLPSVSKNGTKTSITNLIKHHLSKSQPKVNNETYSPNATTSNKPKPSTTNST